jgi:peptidyl-prolyl cis-trans isomerase A (cyclophilin A)
MTRRITLAALALALAAPAFATQPSAQSPMAEQKEDLVKVALDTAAGRIVVALDRARAPITTANFLHYVDSGRFNGATFYRAMPNDSKGGLIQGGITDDARKMFAPIAHEPTNKTGLHHVAGTISMAREAPGSARSDFFILTADIPGFDAGGPGGDADGFAAFGHVVEGMDVVKAIYAAPTSPTKGDGIMKGQMLEPQVKIVKASRIKE